MEKGDGVAFIQIWKTGVRAKRKETLSAGGSSVGVTFSVYIKLYFSFLHIFFGYRGLRQLLVLFQKSILDLSTMYLHHLLPSLLLSLSAPLITPIHALPATSSVPSPKSLSTPRQRPLPLPVHVVHEFPKGTWIENIALRANDQILINIATTPDLYQVDPLSHYEPILIHSFPGYTSLLGIAEVDPDVFYVIAGNFSLKTFQPTPASNSVF